MPWHNANCEICGTAFTAYRGRKESPPRFCSRKCFYIHRKGKPLKPNQKRFLLTCETCNDFFEVTASRMKQNPRFCSTTCFYAWLNGSERTPRVEFECPICGKRKRIRKSTYDDGRAHYCSQACMMVARPKTPTKPKVECVCRMCGATFEIYPSWARKGEGKFCSRRCCMSYTNKYILRPGPTSIETALADELDARGLVYESQYPLAGFILDFAFPARKLAVEADGIYWHALERVREKDARKETALVDQGWTLLRFDGDEIRASASSCVDAIVKRLKELH